MVGAGLAVVLVLGVVGLRVQQVRLSYRLDALRQGRAELEETNRRLRVEMATLKSLSRIEGKARGELGMVAPGRDQVRARPRVRPGRRRLAPRRSTGARSSAAKLPGAAGSASVTP